jgi:hypothetical protein
MKLCVKYLFILALTPLVLSICPTFLFSQTNSPVTEPQIPVYFFANQENATTSGASDSALIILKKRIDSVETTFKIASAKQTTHFTWLYTLIALSATMNIALFFVIIHMRRELALIKQFEHQQKLEKAESDLVQTLPPSLQEPLFEEKEIKEKPVRRPKPRAKRSK